LSQTRAGRSPQSQFDTHQFDTRQVDTRFDIRVNQIHPEAEIMRRATVLLLAVAAGVIETNVRAEEITLETALPVVVKTVPEAGGADVDPGLTEIKVSFSKDMTAGSWSWARESKQSFPKTDGEPKYLDDKRTCVLPVKLEPGKTYAIWLNSGKFGNFKDASGRPAVPYLLVFKTK
jgi:hypothetical protein